MVKYFIYQYMLKINIKNDKIISGYVNSLYITQHYLPFIQPKYNQLNRKFYLR